MLDRAHGGPDEPPSGFAANNFVNGQSEDIVTGRTCTRQCGPESLCEAEVAACATSYCLASCDRRGGLCHLVSQNRTNRRLVGHSARGHCVGIPRAALGVANPSATSKCRFCHTSAANGCRRSSRGAGVELLGRASPPARHHAHIAHLGAMGHRPCGSRAGKCRPSQCRANASPVASWSGWTGCG